MLLLIDNFKNIYILLKKPDTFHADYNYKNLMKLNVYKNNWRITLLNKCI